MSGNNQNVHFSITLEILLQLNAAAEYSTVLDDVKTVCVRSKSQVTGPAWFTSAELYPWQKRSVGAIHCDPIATSDESSVDVNTRSWQLTICNASKVQHRRQKTCHCYVSFSKTSLCS
jgi:hypothetical protein